MQKLKQLYSYILLIINNWYHYRYWRKIQKGKITIDYKRGAGYYIPVNSLAHTNEWTERFEMESGNVGIYELVDIETYSNPHDMIKESYWHFIGYEGEKPVKECTFREFIDIYVHH